jgi:hypothetical protein
MAVMDNLFDRLTIKVAEPVRLKIILRNLSPFYQSQIGVQPVRSRDKLLEIGRVMDARKASVESFVPPVSRKNPKVLGAGSGVRFFRTEYGSHHVRPGTH